MISRLSGLMQAARRYSSPELSERSTGCVVLGRQGNLLGLPREALGLAAPFPQMQEGLE